mmetsp:Transcript_62102/g.96480  ORF Transcript_62102/g.96480 Transcript_62102/m.96480 type:complete len:95 (+) Transcript_62102:455-739(+)
MVTRKGLRQGFFGRVTPQLPLKRLPLFVLLSPRPINVMLLLERGAVEKRSESELWPRRSGRVAASKTLASGFIDPALSESSRGSLTSGLAVSSQ